MRDNKGITLVMLVITIIILMIILGIGIGSAVGIKSNVANAKDGIAMRELSEVQQAILETYIKYKQTNNSNILIGTSLDYTVAQQYLNELSSDLELKLTQEESSSSIEKGYYKLGIEDLESLGIKIDQETYQNVHGNAYEVEYVVNYSTGEVFNYTTKVTSQEKALYLYATE